MAVSIIYATREVAQMDLQTRIGIGFTLLTCVVGVLWQMIPYPLNLILVAVFAVGALWCFAPLLTFLGLERLTIFRVPVQKAMQFAYEQCEKSSAGEIAASMFHEPQERLTYFYYALVQNGVAIFACKPPSTVPYRLDPEETGFVHPIVGTNDLRYSSPAGVAYTNASVPWFDLWRVVSVLKRQKLK